MRITKEDVILFLIAIVAFGFRLFYSFLSPFYSSDQAYFHLRHSEYISSHFLPLIRDPLSYGGNVILNSHVWHYLLAFFDVFFSQSFVYKVIPAFLASSIVIIVYLYARELTNNEYAAFFAALLSAFIPIYLKLTLNQISLLSFYMPVFLLILYSLLNIQTHKKMFIFLTFILVLLDPLNFLALFTLLIYGVLLVSESIEMQKIEKEAVGFVVVFFAFINLIMFRPLYLEQGLAAVWQNLPLDIYGSLFQNFDLFETIGVIGIVPLILGILGFVLAREKNRTTILLGSVLMADFVLLLLKLVPFEQGVLFLTIILCITSAVTIRRVGNYLWLTKLSTYQPFILGAIVLVSLISVIVPSIMLSQQVLAEGVTPGEIESLEWIRDNTRDDAVVAGNVLEGNLIISIANRTNIIDTQFFTVENRIFDVETIFTSQSLVNAKKSLDKYSVDYVYFSQKTKNLYNVERLVYTSDDQCFKQRFKNAQATVYQVVC